jgi:hypothetical protein
MISSPPIPSKKRNSMIVRCLSLIYTVTFHFLQLFCFTIHWTTKTLRIRFRTNILYLKRRLAHIFCSLLNCGIASLIMYRPPYILKL